MLLELLQSLFNKLGIIVLVAFFLSRSGIIKGYLAKAELSLRDKVMFSIIFGALGILGTYSGVPVQGAIANSRSIGVIVAGLFGGPFVGITAGIIAGVHRMVIPTGRFTAVACGVSTILGGVIAGYAKPYILKQKRKWIYGAVLTVIIEAVQMGIIMLIARPFADAVNLVKVIFIPMAFINSFGTGAFILLIEQINEENDNSAAIKAGLSLKIAANTLAILRKGLNQKSASQVCDIIYEYSGADAVSITNREIVLGHVGIGTDHHIPGNEVSTEITKHVIKRGQYAIANTSAEIECSNPKCKLSSVVIVPLYMNEHMIGTLKLYRTSAYGIRMTDIELAKGLAYLFSNQLELSRLSYQEELLQKTEFKALQAQIQPHFLFNALNTIISLCRTDALKARELLTKLSLFLRKSFTTNDQFIPIGQEVDHIQNYLSIEEVRFANRLQVNYDIQEDLTCLVPPLILQPLVENALKHGLADKADGGVLNISVKCIGEAVECIIEDNGKGMSEEKLAQVLASKSQGTGIGLRNVKDRMKVIYGTDIEVQSEPDIGTRVKVTVPTKELAI